MDLDSPLKMRQGDMAGTPVALIDLCRKQEDLALLRVVDSDNVQIEYVMGEVAQQQTGYRRFVRLRKPTPSGCRHALVEKIPGGATLPQVEEGLSNSVRAQMQRDARLANRA